MRKCIKAVREENKAVVLRTMAEFLHMQVMLDSIKALFFHTKAVFLQILCALDLFVLEIHLLSVMLENNVARISNAEPFLDIAVLRREIGQRKLGVKERRL